MRILVAERDYHQGRFITQMLTLAGHDVHMCDTPDDLNRTLDGELPDAVLFELLDGLDTAGTVDESDAQPVVIITSGTTCKALGELLERACRQHRPARSRLSPRICNLAMENLLRLCHSMQSHQRLRSREVELARCAPGEAGRGGDEYGRALT